MFGFIQRNVFIYVVNYLRSFLVMLDYDFQKGCFIVYGLGIMGRILSYFKCSILKILNIF